MEEQEPKKLTLSIKVKETTRVVSFTLYKLSTVFTYYLLLITYYLLLITYYLQLNRHQTNCTTTTWC